VQKNREILRHHSALTPDPSPEERGETYDALLLLSFGGPEGPDDVMPFLENVVRGKNVPRERLLEVAEHYEMFDGVSPINAQNRALLAALVAELNAHGPQLPVYWGNRNWHPLLADTVGQMAEDGVHHALAFVTSAFGSYPGCRQYLEEIERARQEVGPEAPRIDKLRLFYNHPGFIEAMADRVGTALAEVPAERRSAARLIYTAHSIPAAIAKTSPYEHQLRCACRLVTEQRGRESFSPQGATGSLSASAGLEGGKGEVDWDLVFQSRSGPPAQPWLEPDIRDYIRQLHGEGDCPNSRRPSLRDGARARENETVPFTADLVIVPIGFLAEQMELVYDLDVEVRQLCDELGINMVRAATVGNHPRLVRMIRELVLERIDPSTPQLALGADGPWPDQCPDGCCLPG
jgi:ferrochelatase